MPLYALIQERSEPAYRSRIIAANNILNALFMVASAGIAHRAAQGRACRFRSCSSSTGLLNAVVALYIYTLVPEFLMRFLAWLLVHTIYRVRQARASSNIPGEGPCVLVCNHVSFVDADRDRRLRAPRPIRFVMDHRIFRVPVLNRSSSARCARFRSRRRRRIAALKERAFDEAAAALRGRRDRRHLSRGQAHRRRRAQSVPPGRASASSSETPVPVVPMALRGLWGSFFSRSTTARRCASLRGVFSRIALVAGPPVPPERATPE